MKLYDAVIDRLKRLMHEKAATIYSLGRDGGIAYSTTSQLLNKKQNKITIDILFEITATLGVSLKEFFDDPIFDEVTD